MFSRIWCNKILIPLSILLLTPGVLAQLTCEDSDINTDNDMNLADLIEISLFFGLSTGDAGYDPARDLNSDGYINIIDLSFVSVNIGCNTITTCTDSGEDDYLVDGESDCNQCDHPGDDDGDQGGSWPSAMADDCDSDCGIVDTTVLPADYQSPETSCFDSIDNDCDGESDHDTQDGRHGDSDCPVSITGISVSQKTPNEDNTITVSCTSSVAGVNSILAGISSACTYVGCSGDSANFTCTDTSSNPFTITIEYDFGVACSLVDWDALASSVGYMACIPESCSGGTVDFTCTEDLGNPVNITLWDYVGSCASIDWDVLASALVSPCSWASWVGNTASFTCNTGDTTGLKMVGCYVNRSRSYNGGSEYLSPIRVYTSDCVGYGDPAGCNNNPNCEWCYSCNTGQYSNGIDRCVDKGNCMYSCEADPAQCGATCDLDTVPCPDTECDNLDSSVAGCYPDGTWRDYSDESNDCQTDCSCESNPCTTYTVSVTDADGDGFDTECDGDCDDNPGACGSDCHPGADELCDGYDNDCDGDIDEDFNEETCYLLCAYNYNAGRSGDLRCCGDDPNEGSPYQSTETSCYDGNDNDCDGARDSYDPDCSTACTYFGEHSWFIDGEPDCNQCDHPGDDDYDQGSLAWVMADQCDSDCGTVSRTVQFDDYESPETSCYDDIDNDCDGAVDFYDLDCSALCGNTGENDWFILGQPDCNQCDHLGDDDDDQGGWRSEYTDPCDVDCGPAATTVHYTDYQLTETRCDLIDNDCDGTIDEGCGGEICDNPGDEDSNGQSDYDSLDGLHGDILCPVAITGISMSSYIPPDEYTTVNLFCKPNIHGVNSVEASLGGTPCTFTEWAGSSAKFSCDTGAAGTKTAVCSIDTAKSYQSGSDRTMSVTVQSAFTCGDSEESDYFVIGQPDCNQCNHPGDDDGDQGWWDHPMADQCDSDCGIVLTTVQLGDYESTEESCYDGIDNDCDGDIDSADSDCSGSCGNTGEDDWFVSGQPDCNQCDHLGDDDGDQGSPFPPSLWLDQCDSDCGIVSTTVLAADYESTETRCDGIDNDCDGTVDEGCSGEICGNGIDDDGNSESDYDSLDGLHGDVLCPVAITGMSMSDTTPNEYTTVDVYCTPNIHGVNSVEASLGGTPCTFTEWAGSSAKFSCDTGAAGTKTAVCSIDTAKSYQSGSDRTTTVIVEAASNTCNSCVSCTAALASASPGDTIRLTADITGVNTVCVDFGGTDGVTFDCDGHSITGDGGSGGVGISLNSGSDSNVVRDCSSISNLEKGVDISSSDWNTLSNIASTGNNAEGIKIQSSHSNTLSKTVSIFNGAAGITIQGSSINMMGSHVMSNSGPAIAFVSTYAGDGTSYIYNNVFDDNAEYITLVDSAPEVVWNTELDCDSGTNVLGGSCMGGNYWGNSAGTGLSDTCVDSDSNGICDSGYNLTCQYINWTQLHALSHTLLDLLKESGICTNTGEHDCFAFEEEFNWTDCNQCNHAGDDDGDQGLWDHPMADQCDSDCGTVLTTVQPGDYESTETSCSDGIDNDCDGDKDSADSDCSGSAITCNSCTSCTAALASASPGDIIRLTADITGVGNIRCVDFGGGTDGVTFDCGGHSITGDDVWEGVGITLDSGSDNNVVRNCPDISGLGTGIVIYLSSSNLIENVHAHSNYRGLSISRSASNTVRNSSFQENDWKDFDFNADSESECSNSLVDVVGSGGRPIGIYNSAVNLEDQVFSSLVLCNADYSNLQNVGINGSTADRNNGFYMFFTDSSVITGMECISNSGIGIYHSNFNTFSDIISRYNSDDGIYMYYSDHNTFQDIQLLSNSEIGIYVWFSDYNEFTGINMKYHGVGMYIDRSGGITVRDSIISSCGAEGIIFLDAETYPTSYIYNNIFSDNVQDIGVNTVNPPDIEWNTPLDCSSGPNIIGGSCMGGNFWGNLEGTGFSETCTDSDSNGICDSGYTIASGQTDNYPLAQLAGTCNSCADCTSKIRSASPGDTIQLTADIPDVGYLTCISFGGADGITFDCGGHSIIGNNTHYKGFGISLGYGSNNNVVRNCPQLYGLERAVTIHSDSNLIENVHASYNQYGLWLYRGTHNTVRNSSFWASYYNDFHFHADSESECSNSLVDVIGSGAYPIGFYNSSVDMVNQRFSTLVLCNADGSDMDGGGVWPTMHRRNNGIYMFFTDNSIFSRLDSEFSRDGIKMIDSHHNTFFNAITVVNSRYGIYMDSSHHNTFWDSQASWSGHTNLFLMSSNNNRFFDMLLEYNSTTEYEQGTQCIHIQESGGTTLTGSTITSCPEGISFQNVNSSYPTSYIYNNIFDDNDQDVVFYTSTPDVEWNTALDCGAGPNIIGGSCMGGNFWGNSEGTGFSEICVDEQIDGDRICNFGYTIASGQTDNYPLTDRTCGFGREHNMFIDGEPDCNQCDHLGDDDGDQGGWHHPYADQCDSNCGTVSRTVQPEDYQPVEASCSDGIDNDCNGRSDYDSWDGLPGDYPYCTVSIYDMSVSDKAPSSYDTIEVSCASSPVGGINSVVAGVTPPCTYVGCSGNTANFTCTDTNNNPYAVTIEHDFGGPCSLVDWDALAASALLSPCGVPYCNSDTGTVKFSCTELNSGNPVTITFWNFLSECTRQALASSPLFNPCSFTGWTSNWANFDCNVGAEGMKYVGCYINTSKSYDDGAYNVQTISVQ